MKRKELAQNYFIDGYNCCQAVVLAFKDLFDLDEKTIIKLSSGFGGGVAQLREVCGAFSGIVFVMNMLYGSDNSSDKQSKAELYQRIQYLANEFKAKNKSIICKELKGMSTLRDEPNQRLEVVPCLELVKDAAEILDNYLKTN